jgi:predicted TIM-barrel fold metal-dependent hydrolase
MSKVMLISSDGHATALQKDFLPYLDEEIRPDFQAWLDGSGAAYVGINAHPDIDKSANYDSAYRLRDLETQGVVAEVIFPNSLPFGFAAEGTDAGGGEKAKAQVAAALRGYNRWLADFVAQAPSRRAGMAVVTFDNVEEAVRTVRWAKEHGMRGIQLPGPAGEPWFFEERLDPFWAACQDVELPVVQHAAGILPRPIPIGFAGLMTLAIESSFFTSRSFHQMFLGGVFERFPRLRYVVTEGGSGWIPERVAMIDAILRSTGDWKAFADFIGRENTFAQEVWQQNCFVGASTLSSFEGSMRHAIGVPQMMYGIDYPHFEGTYPHTKENIRFTLTNTGATEEELRAILGENAARCYGFDLQSLAPIVEQVGFEMEDLLEPFDSANAKGRNF